MITRERDLQIVQSVGAFRQLATSHIAALHFSELTTSEPLYRALKRLMANGYLSRIERRLVGGSRAGSGQYVYQITRRGAVYLGWEKHTTYRAIHPHTLAIADAFIELLQLERSGVIEILDYDTEPNTWRRIAGREIRADLYADIGKLHRGTRERYWFEIDMGTERPSILRAKIDDYAHVYRNGGGELTTMPTVVFLVPDERRKFIMREIIEQQPDEVQAFLYVFRSNEFARLLFD